MARAVLNSINSRLDARTISVLLSHSETKVLLADSQFLPIVREALRLWSPSKDPYIIVIDDSLNPGTVNYGELVEYEELLQRGDPAFPIQWPEDDWETISLNYTSGTTSRPKGVLYHHRYYLAITISTRLGLCNLGFDSLAFIDKQLSSYGTNNHANCSIA